MARYYYVVRHRGMPTERDIEPWYAYDTYEEAARNLERWEDDSGQSVITQLNGRWYRVMKNRHGELIYRSTFAYPEEGWRTKQQIERDV